MAEGFKHSETQEVSEWVELTYNEDVVTYELQLTEDEAQALRKVCALIGGGPYTTRRRLMDNITRALERVGITSPENDHQISDTHHTSGIVFLDHKVDRRGRRVD